MDGKNARMKKKIDVKGLSFRFEDRPILKEINFSAVPGQFIGIIGPNGSGKTTLLRNISAALQPKKDTVFIDGQDILGLKAKALGKKMAYVPQSTHVEFDFTVEDIVLMGRNPYLRRFQQEGDEDLRIARDAMELAGVLPLKNRSITELSGGERQRVLIARAVAQQSDIILLDEPISNLDIKYQIEILSMVKDLTLQKGITVACVLHDLNMAAFYCQHLILLHQGSIYAQGQPVEVLKAETIREVYGLEVNVLKNPDSGLPFIIPNFKS